MSGSVLRDSFTFSWSRNLLLVLSFVRNLVLARLLGPDGYGWWVVLWLVLTYGDQVHLGLRHAGDREIPSVLGSGDSQRAMRLARVILGGILILALSGVMIFLGVNIVCPWGPAGMQWTLAVAAMTVLADQFSRYHLMLLRVHREFAFSGRVEVAFEVARTALVCAGAWWDGVRGAIAAFFLVSVAMGTVLGVRHGEASTPLFSRAELRPVARSAGPLFLSGIGYIVITSIDRVAGSLVLSARELGLYGMGALVMQLPAVTSQAVSAVLYPRMSSEIGRSGTVEPLRGMYTTELRSVALIGPVLVMVLLFGSEVLVGSLLPAYEQSLPVMGYLGYGAVCFALIPLPMGLFMVTGRNAEFLFILAFGVLSGGISMVLLRQYFPAMIALAIGSDVLFWVALSALLLRGAYHLGFRKWETIREAAITLSPLATSTILFALIAIFLPGTARAGGVDAFGHGACKALVFLVGFAPVTLMTGWRLKLIQRFRAMALQHGPDKNG